MVQSENLSWDEYLYSIAEVVAKKSKDQNTKVGCVVVGPNNEIRTTGYNNFPRKINDNVPARHERPEKLNWIIHAECNAIVNAARVGTPLDGCRLYTTLFPCCTCSMSIIQAGIVEITSPRPNLDNERWGDLFKRSLVMFNEAGIKINYV